MNFMFTDDLPGMSCF